MGKKRRIMHGLTEVAGQNSYSVQGLKQIGENAETVIYCKHPFAYKYDRCLNIDRSKRILLPLNALKMLGFYISLGGPVTFKNAKTPSDLSQLVAATFEIKAQMFSCVPPNCPPSLEKICFTLQSDFILLAYIAGKCSHFTQGGLPTIKSKSFSRAINIKLVEILTHIPSYAYT